ncbi:MAG: acyl-CoA dehydrogenase, partial [Acetobacteraceae bacterium]
MTQTPILADLQSLTKAALPQVEALFIQARDTLKTQVSAAGKVSNQALEARQFQAHSLAWLATYVEALRQLDAWATRLHSEGKLGQMEALILQIGFGEYLTQIAGGIPMSQTEFARLSDLGLSYTPGPHAATLMAEGNTPDARHALVA